MDGGDDGGGNSDRGIHMLHNSFSQYPSSNCLNILCKRECERNPNYLSIMRDGGTGPLSQNNKTPLGSFWLFIRLLF